jgi:endo-1,4-beta-xylanase
MESASHPRHTGKTPRRAPALLPIFCLCHFLCAAPSGQEALRELAAGRGLDVGAAVGGAFWGGDARYRELLRKECGILVAENAMKWGQVQPEKGRFDWSRADGLVAFAAGNGAALRGHALVWHQQAGWVEASAGLGRDEMLALLREHIRQVVGRYAGKVPEWDVVNEAVDDGAGFLRDSFWLRRIGDGYIDSAFRMAHAADPRARLFYNDYGAEGQGTKSDKVYALVKGMLDRGVPIHGVGMQCHFSNEAPLDVDGIARNIRRLGDLGLEVSLTEVDFRIRLPTDSQALARQKSNYSALLGVCLSRPNCKSFLTWGLTDAHSWVPAFFPGMGAALLFDAEYRPKPAYHGLRETLAAAQDSFLYIQNDSIRLAVRKDYGAGIAFLAKRPENRNLLNHADHGRLIQQSFYGDNDGSTWNGKPWTWNPVQGGCWNGTRSGIVEELKSDGKSLYARTRPINWGGCDEIDAVMEQWIRLAGNVAHVHFRFRNGSRGNTGARHQEMPAVFMDYALPNLVYYKGQRPWTGDALTRRVPAMGNTYDTLSENWAAYLDDKDWGAGAFTPGTDLMTYYRFTGDGRTGPSGGATSYFSPIRTLRVAAGFLLEYDVYLYVGAAAAMREEFRYIHENGVPSRPYADPSTALASEGDGWPSGPRSRRMVRLLLRASDPGTANPGPRITPLGRRVEPTHFFSP